VDGAPVMGHVKGAEHQITEDEEHGWESIKSATSTSSPTIGGVLGSLTRVINGHTLKDAAMSGGDFAINGSRST